VATTIPAVQDQSVPTLVLGQMHATSQECLQTRLIEFEAKFDLQLYKARAFQDAGKAEIDLKEMFASTSTKDRQACVDSLSVEAVM
jgi:hypothetical protein